jgi:Rieske Fe-S protein
MARHCRPWWRSDGTSDASKGWPQVDETENRRTFCVRGCQALSVKTAALLLPACGGITRFFLLARLTPETFSALNAVCTHEGCTVSRFASPVFVCPCHGSRYTTSGEVVQGPAPAALPRYPTEFANGVLTVRF